MHQSLKRKSTTTHTTDLSFGGAFALPEFKLLIKTDTSSMDVFGIGIDFETNPWWHFVVDEECAHSLIKEGIYPSSIVPKNWSKFTRNISTTCLVR